MRAFFAVDLPDDLAPRVADAQAALGDAAGLALVDPEQTHVTLKFLGDIAEDNDDTTPTLTRRRDRRRQTGGRDR